MARIIIDGGGIGPPSIPFQRHSTMHTTPPIPDAATLKTWSRDEYYRLADCGWFQDERTELIGGRIYVVSPQSFLHAAAVDCVAKLLHDRMGETFWVRSQLPLFCSADSEPEPDSRRSPPGHVRQCLPVRCLRPLSERNHARSEGGVIWLT